MFREMRRKDKALTAEGIAEVLHKGDFGTLSVNGQHGYPYSIALNFAYDDKAVYIHSARTGEKIDALAQDSRVCFNVVSAYEILRSTFDTDYRNVVLFGRAVELEGDEKKYGLELLIKKYSGDFYDAGMQYIDKAAQGTRVFRIDIEHMTGKHQG